MVAVTVATAVAGIHEEEEAAWDDVASVGRSGKKAATWLKRGLGEG
jgi:hypothetical protein